MWMEQDKQGEVRAERRDSQGSGGREQRAMPLCNTRALLVHMWWSWDAEGSVNLAWE